MIFRQLPERGSRPRSFTAKDPLAIVPFRFTAQPIGDRRAIRGMRDRFCQHSLEASSIDDVSKVS